MVWSVTALYSTSNHQHKTNPLINAAAATATTGVDIDPFAFDVEVPVVAVAFFFFILLLFLRCTRSIFACLSYSFVQNGL